MGENIDYDNETFDFHEAMKFGKKWTLKDDVILTNNIVGKEIWLGFNKPGFYTPE